MYSNWNEQDHPRDDGGKFTFKNRGSSVKSIESPASVLYRDAKIKEEKDKQESEYKSKLLNILGNKATNTDVSYGTTKELEEKIKEYGLENKLKGKVIGAAANTNMTPIKEMYKRQKGYSPNPNYKVDNSIFSDDMIKKQENSYKVKKNLYQMHTNQPRMTYGQLVIDIQKM